MGAVAAVIIGTPTFRLRGHYFALSMLAYPLAILYFMQYLGFQEVSLPMHRENPAAYLEFSDPHYYTIVAVGLLFISVIVCILVENSRFGLALLAIRQNELAAEAAGIDARTWKMRALIVSGMMAAGAGGMYACVQLVVTPDSVFGLAGLRAAGGDDAVRRGRLAVGPGDRGGVPRAAFEIAGRVRRRLSARHSGRGLRGSGHRDHPRRP